MQLQALEDFSGVWKLLEVFGSIWKLPVGNFHRYFYSLPGTSTKHNQMSAIRERFKLVSSERRESVRIYLNTYVRQITAAAVCTGTLAAHECKCRDSRMYQLLVLQYRRLLVQCVAATAAAAGC